MKFSVVVPVFNTEGYLDSCMKALLAQDYPASDYEIFAIDNGSTDGSLNRLRQYPRVNVLEERRRGSYAARNTGLNQTRGNILAFTDSDCAPAPDWLRTIEQSLSLPGRKVVLGKRQTATDIGLMRAINQYEITKDAFALSSHEAEKYYGYTNNMGVKRETWQHYGPFIERDRGADTIFVRSVVDGESCNAVVFNPDMVVKHLEMDSFNTYAKKMFIYGRSRKRYQNLKVTKALNFTDRLKIFWIVARQNGLVSHQNLLLAGVLACSMVTWHAGSFMGTIESLSKSDQ